MSYQIAQEQFRETLRDLWPLYRQHYGEMQDRLERDGVQIADFNPRVDQYCKAADAEYLLNYVVRHDGAPVGYSNLYLTNDMHNGELIAQEDTIYVLPEHRNGIGKKLSLFILDDLKKRGVKRLSVTAVTDLRVAKLWQRMGFKHTAHHMTFTF